MSDEPQDTAEAVDEEMVGSDPLLSDEVRAPYPPDHYLGVRFADADVTDESVAERAAQEEPEDWEYATHEEPVGLSEGPGADEQLEQIIEP
jgi:hypothetical protein